VINILIIILGTEANSKIYKEFGKKHSIELPGFFRNYIKGNID
jgi:hypothetical protein